MQYWTTMKDYCDKIFFSDFKVCPWRSLLIMTLLIIVFFGTGCLYCYYLSQFGVEYNKPITPMLLISYIVYAIWTFCDLWLSCIRYRDNLNYENEIKSINRVEDNNNYMLIGLSFVFGWVTSQSQSNIIRLPPGGINLIILAILFAVLGFLFYPPPPWIRLNGSAALTQSSGSTIPAWWIVFLRSTKSLFGMTSLMLSMLVLLNTRSWGIL